MFLLRLEELCKLAVVSGFLGRIEQDRLGLAKEFLDDLERAVRIGSLRRVLLGGWSGTFAGSDLFQSGFQGRLDRRLIGAERFEPDDLVVVELRGLERTLEVFFDRCEDFVHRRLAFHVEFAVLDLFATQALVQASLLEQDKASEHADPEHHEQRGAVADQQEQQVRRAFVPGRLEFVGGSEQIAQAVGETRNPSRDGQQKGETGKYHHGDKEHPESDRREGRLALGCERRLRFVGTFGSQNRHL